MRRTLVIALVFLSFTAMHVQQASSQVHVYDKNDQYLGIILSAQNLELYNSRIDRLIMIDPYTKTYYERPLYYKTTNCTGQAYSIVSPNGLLFGNSGRIYEVRIESEIFSPSSVFANNSCQQSGGNYPWPYAQVKSYSGTNPFSVPVSLPLRYSADSPVASTTTVVIPLFENNK